MKNVSDTVLYEIGVKFDPKMIIPVVAAVTILALPVLFSFIYKKRSNINDIQPGAIIRTLNIISVCFTLIIITVTTFFAILSVKEYKTLMDTYQRSEYLTVEGEVRDFSTSENGTESFKIQEITFSYSPGFDYGYNVTVSNGGVITGNGQYLKIGYVEYNGVNKIVYIENIQK